VVICLERGADLHMAQLMPLPLTVSCFSKIQIGFTFLVSAHPGSPGKRAVKRVCVCVCVCVCVNGLLASMFVGAAMQNSSERSKHVLSYGCLNAAAVGVFSFRIHMPGFSSNLTVNSLHV